MSEVPALTFMNTKSVTVFFSQVLWYDALQDDWREAEPLLFPRLAYVASVQVFFFITFYGSVAICDD